MYYGIVKTVNYNKNWLAKSRSSEIEGKITVFDCPKKVNGLLAHVINWVI